jgi:hypothetical protein
MVMGLRSFAPTRRTGSCFLLLLSSSTLERLVLILLGFLLIRTKNLKPLIYVPHGEPEIAEYYREVYVPPLPWQAPNFS